VARTRRLRPVRHGRRPRRGPGPLAAAAGRSGGRRPAAAYPRGGRGMKGTAETLALAPAVPSARLADYLTLVRPRVAVMVLVTVLMGGLLAGDSPVPSLQLLHAVLATGLVTAAASILNQWVERSSDARMPRTANRPLPTGRLGSRAVFALGTACCVGGLTYMLLAVPHPLAAGVTAFTFASYLGLYTPLKRVTTLNTLIGAVPGALPPVIGWVAVRGRFDTG